MAVVVGVAAGDQAVAFQSVQGRVDLADVQRPAPAGAVLELPRSWYP
ncbi:hypothetical protein [Curtobacterium sp. Arg-1]|nr:hypothetical protein [Curtobacterium sp. Arg-1]